jgi:hypothetical protein
MANNLLVDWLNKKPKATLRSSAPNVQTSVNNNTASNMKNITAPALNTGGMNLQKGVQPTIQQPAIQQPVTSPTNNVPAAVAQLSQQPYQPKTDL